MLRQVLTWVILMGLGSSLFAQAPSDKARSMPEFHWLVTEGEEIALNTNLSLSELAQSLQQQGYQLTVESGVLYAIPPNYFQEAKRAVRFLEELELFQPKEIEQLSDELAIYVQQIFSKYKLTGPFEIVTLTAGVTLFYEQGGRWEMEPLVAPSVAAQLLPSIAQQAIGSDVELPIQPPIISFFSPSLPPPPSPEKEEKIRQYRQMIEEPQSRGQFAQAPSAQGIATPSEPLRSRPMCSKVGLLIFAEVRSLSPAERARLSARYFQLVAQRLTEEHRRWEQQAAKFASHFLKERPDWQGWKGNQWEGRFGDLPPDIQAKIQAYMQQRKDKQIAPHTSVRLRINPVLSLSRLEEAGVYSTSFSLSPPNRP